MDNLRKIKIHSAIFFPLMVVLEIWGGNLAYLMIMMEENHPELILPNFISRIVWIILFIVTALNVLAILWILEKEGPRKRTTDDVLLQIVLCIAFFPFLAVFQFLFGFITILVFLPPKSGFYSLLYQLSHIFLGLDVLMQVGGITLLGYFIVRRVLLLSPEEYQAQFISTRGKKDEN